MSRDEKKCKIYSQRQFINSIGKNGSGPGQFRFPDGVAFDWRNNQLVISDPDNHSIQLLDRREMNKHLRRVGARGSQPGQFYGPKGVSFQPIVDNLLVCDSANHRIKMMNQEDKVLAIIGTTGQTSTRDGQFNYPIGVTCAPNGHFFVADLWNHRVQLFDASGRFLGKLGRKGFYGEEAPNYPNGVLVLDNRFTPSSIASSVLMIGDSSYYRLSLWCVDGSRHIRNIHVKALTRGVCVDLKGFVYVSTEAHRVEVLDPRKDFACLQTIGYSWSSEPGHFNKPNGLCVDDTNILMVVDTNNHRLQFFE